MVDMSAELIENMPGSLPGWTLKDSDGDLDDDK